MFCVVRVTQSLVSRVVFVAHRLSFCFLSCQPFFDLRLLITSLVSLTPFIQIPVLNHSGIKVASGWGYEQVLSLPQARRELVDMIEIICLATDYQRPVLANCCKLGATGSCLLLALSMSSTYM